jgi:flagellar protein FliJ
MKRHQSLYLAIDVAARSRDHWRKSVQAAAQSLSFANDQMQQLTSYASEKDAQWARSAQLGTTPEMLRHHFQFMTRLQQAVALQRVALNGLEAELAKRQTVLRDAQVRVLALQHVLASKLATDATYALKRERKHMDEFASLMHLRQANQRTLESAP